MESSLTDMATLGKLLKEHEPRLLAMLRRRLDPALHARIDAEDIYSEVFLVGQRHFSQWARWPHEV